jgi:putative ABC transport system substrate-binding protein
MRRRQFIAGLGSAAAWPLTARAQQRNRTPRIGILMYTDESDELSKARVSAMTRALADLGWTGGVNVQLDVRFAANDLDRVRNYARELVDLQPNLVVATATPVTLAFQRATQTTPIVFVGISDPIGSGFVESLARPGRNLTGFVNIEAGMGGKWLELLRELAPGIKQVALMYNPGTATGLYYMPAMEAAARSFDVASMEAPVRSDLEIEAFINSLGRQTGGGLILPPDGFTTDRRLLIAALAARNSVPSISATAAYVRGGGLLSYGPDQADIYRRSASYVDRILRGAKPAELPVQVPVKFEMAVNAKTAKALGLAVPQSILLLADEVIE